VSFFNNWIAKSLSILAALAIFYHVRSSRNVTRDIQVRVVPPQLRWNLTFYSKIPAYINVRLSGPKELMDFPVSEFKILLKNNNPKPRVNIFRTKLKPELPTGISAQYKRGIEITLDRRATARLPIDPRFNLKPDAGTEFGYFQVSPLQFSYGDLKRWLRNSTELQLS